MLDRNTSCRTSRKLILNLLSPMLNVFLSVYLTPASTLNDIPFGEM